MSINNYPTFGEGVASQSHRYEEFLSDSTECPTCRGLGRIKKGNEELVALIPVSDSRLKPRKTVLYVALAIAVSAIIGGLLLFFLVERSVQLNSNLQIVIPKSLKIENVTHYLTVVYQVPINISNENYLPVSISDLQLSSLLYGDRMLDTVHNKTKVTVPMRSTVIHYVTVNMTLGDNKDIFQVLKACQSQSPILWKLPMNFQVQADIEYLSNSQTTSVTLYNRKVCCHVKSDEPNDYPLPPIGLDCSAM